MFVSGQRYLWVTFCFRFFVVIEDFIGNLFYRDFLLESLDLLQVFRAGLDKWNLNFIRYRLFVSHCIWELILSHTDPVVVQRTFGESKNIIENSGKWKTTALSSSYFQS